MSLKVVFRSEELSELGVEIEWRGSYLNVCYEGRDIACRSFIDGLDFEKAYREAEILAKELLSNTFDD